MEFSLADADYKVVTYIDSVGCTSCKLQLPRWKLFMQEVDSTLNRPVPVSYTHLDVYKRQVCKYQPAVLVRRLTA